MATGTIRQITTPLDYRRGVQAVLQAPGHLEFQLFVPPHPGPGEVLIAVRCALSCGTDLKFYRRGHPMFKTPSPFGHEFSGEVVEVGRGVDNFRIGDALMAAPTAPCGNCFYCRREQENLCPEVMPSMVWGAYANYLLVPRHVVDRNSFKKPGDLSYQEAALLEPLSCVVHAQEFAQPQPHESVLILGAGAFGLLHLMTLKALGIRDVTVAGRRHNRLLLAGEFGADRIIDVERSDLRSEMAKLNGGYGPDLVIEATGQVSGWEDAIGAVRRGGRVVFFGGCPGGTEVRLDTRRMHYDNLTLLSPFHFRPRDVRKAFELLRAHSLGAGRVINAHRKLSDLKEVLVQLEQGAFLKCALQP